MQFALHRFISAEQLDTACVENKDFNLQKFIEEGAFEFVNEGAPLVDLELKISSFVEKHLAESKLSENQTIEHFENHVELKATVKNTKQLRWWLMSFGPAVEVINPKEFREEFKINIEKLHNLYKAP
jgi:predicted DNA-binding transcriptional regulator YafY